MKTTIEMLKKELATHGSRAKATVVQRYFKTGKGEYGAGDIFLGVTVPQQRIIAKKYLSLSLNELQKLLRSPIHEHRMTALFVLIEKYRLSSRLEQKSIFALCCKNTRSINNWDLVDTVAPSIFGPELFGRSTVLLTRYARSKHLWERRIGIVTTQYFIRQGSYKETIGVAKILLHDTHDLIHKAVGWMLREVGDREKKTELAFLDRYAAVMPRTMLRYAIEKFPKQLQQRYLRKKRIS